MKIFKTLFIFVVVLFLNSCQKENSSDPSDLKPTLYPEIIVNDQIISRNQVIIEEATFYESGWIVLYTSEYNAPPEVLEMISQPYYIKKGTVQDIIIQLTNFIYYNRNDKTKIWVVLHKDDGGQESFEYNAISGLDNPYTNSEGEIIKKSFDIWSPQVEAINTKHKDKFMANVTAAVDGWIIVTRLYDNNRTVIGKEKVKQGENKELTILLDEGQTIEKGEKVFLSLIIDNNNLDVFEFPDHDPYEVYGFTQEGSSPIVSDVATVLQI